MEGAVSRRAANVPQDDRANPVRLDRLGPIADAAVQGAAGQGMSVNEQELFRLYQARNATPGARQDLGLRDQEHTVFARDMLERLGPLLGRLVLGVAAPGYSAAKVAAQNYNIDPFGLAQSSPPDFQELMAGLRPIFEGLVPGMGVR